MSQQQDLTLLINMVERSLDMLSGQEGRLSQIEVKLAEYNSLLEYHIHRTNLLEGQVEELKKDAEKVNTHIARVDGAVKLIAIVAGSITFLGTVAKLFGLI